MGNHSIIIKQAGAELCQAQDKLEVIVYIGVKVEFVSTKMFIWTKMFI